MKYIIYYKTTGVIKSISDGDNAPPFDSTNLELLESNLDGVSLFDFYVKNGEITPYPPKPNELYRYNWTGTDWQLNEEYQANLVRAQRDYLLSDSDWVVTKAKEYDEEVAPEWKIYRQELRDITNQPGFPLNVVFPEKPAV